MASDADGETWLVIAATQAQIVNVLPAVEQGLATIDRVLVLIGLDPDAANGAADRANAVAPLPRFWRAIAHEARRAGANRAPERFDIENDKNDLDGWSSLVQAFFQAHPAARRINYVYTGGTTDMSIGTWFGLALLKQQRPEIELEFIAKHANQIAFRHAPDRNVRLRGGVNRLSLEGYLLANGFTEYRPEEARRREDLALAREAVTLGLGRRVFNAGLEQAARLRLRLLSMAAEDALVLDLGKAVAELASEGAVEAGLLAATLEADLTAFARDLPGLLARHAGIRFAAGGAMGRLVFSTPHDARYLKSEWFEDWVWLAVRDALRGTPAEVRLALGVEQSDALQPGHKDYDIDVAVYCNDQLHAIECKARKGNKNELKAAIDRAARGRRLFLGPYGRFFICRAPALSAEARSFEQAERSEVDQIAGKAQIETMLRDLRSLVG